MIVVDASTLVSAALLADTDAEWARQIVATGDLAAPHLAPVEAQQALRGLVARSVVSIEIANQARVDVGSLLIDLHPFAPFAERAWSLRDNLTMYDAWYVALAEALDAPLATMDRRLANAPGVTCEVLAP